MAMAKAGTAMTKPTSGPASAISNKARRLMIGERMRMNAPKRADQRGRRHKERVRRANVIVAAGKKVAEFVRQQNAEQRASERNARQEQTRLAKRPEISGDRNRRERDRGRPRRRRQTGLRRLAS